MTEKLSNVNKNAKSDDNKKIKKDNLFGIISHLINRTHPPLAEQVWPLPEFKIHVARDPLGVRSFLAESENKQVHYVDFEYVVDRIMQFVRFSCGPRLLQGTSFIEKDARELAKYWRSVTKDFSHQIKPIAEASDDSYTFKKLNFDFYEPNDFAAECPAFFELMDRTSNSRALMAWIGSLFYADSDRQQYVWIYGDGQNGKGSLARVLGSVFGSACGWEQVPSENERRFWTSGLLGKRLVVFDDCSNYGFVGQGFFKSLTGGSSVRIEQKNQSPFSADLAVKFMFLSNDKPMLESKKADMRRVIFCYALPPSVDFGPHYERDYLAREAPAFIGHCKKIYREDVLERSLVQIPSETQEIEEIVSEYEDAYQEIVDKYFTIEPLALPHDCVKASELAGILKQEKMTSNFETKRFKSYLERRHGVTRKRVFGQSDRYYDGLVKI